MALICRSFAKINLHLEVLGKRQDGFHELLTIFQTVDLSDQLSLERTSDGIELEVEEGKVPTGPENLAHRAAAAFLERWAPNEGVRIRLSKKIPVGGGLGGGSSNAGAVLLALPELLNVSVSREDLTRVARTLGADVPYFLVCGTALATGRGDEVEPVEELAETELVLATPPLSISTAEVFAEWDQLTVPRSKPSMGSLSQEGSIDWLDPGGGWNDLEELVLMRYPIVRAVYNGLLEAGASMVRLSGSGSTLFARFSESGLSPEWSTSVSPGVAVVTVRTLTRSACEDLRIVA